MNRTLITNDELIIRGSNETQWEVIDASPRDGFIKLYDRVNHREEYKNIREIQTSIVEGNLTVKRLKGRTVAISKNNNVKLNDNLDAANLHLRSILQLKKASGCSFAKAYCQIQTEYQTLKIDSEPFPSRATMYRYLDSSREGLPLLKGDVKKGNRLPRYSKQIEDMICSIAERRYLKSEINFTLKDLIEVVNYIAREHEWIKPLQTISRTFVNKIIRTNLSVDPDIDRMNPKDVPASKSIASQRITIRQPFERVEQDALHLPFYIQTDYGIVNNVHLIHAIDCATGLPVGWNLIVGSPSESDGLKCVESILFPKDDAFAKYGLHYDIGICGSPSLIVYDNGPETKGERMRKLSRLGIDTLHCKSRHPQKKPFIERLNLSLKAGLRKLPGCTRLNGKDGQRDPTKLGDKLCTFEELEKWIIRWYFEDWAHAELKRHKRNDIFEPIKFGVTPAERWKRMQELGYPISLPPTHKDWNHVRFEHEQKKLTRTNGIICRTFHYRGNNMSYLLEKYGETKLNILVNPDDYRQIFVDEGEDYQLVPLFEEFITETTPAHSFVYMQRILKEAYPKEAENSIRTKFRKELFENSNPVGKPSSRKKIKKHEYSQDVAEAIKHDNAVKRAASNPINIKDEKIGSGEEMGSIFTFDDAPPLPIVDRADGRKKE